MTYILKHFYSSITKNGYEHKLKKTHHCKPNRFLNELPLEFKSILDNGRHG